MLIKANAIPRKSKGVEEKFKAVKLKVPGLVFRKVNDVNVIQDVAKNMSYEAGDERRRQEEEEETEESSESEEEDEDEEYDGMEVDRAAGKGKKKSGGWNWKMQMEHNARVEEHNRRMEDAQKAQFFMREYYRQQDWRYAEDKRHYEDLAMNRPATEEYTWVDYRNMERPGIRSENDPRYDMPPYPGIPRPMFYQPPPSHANQGEGSSGSSSGSPWDMAPLAQGLFESIFSYPPPPPQ